MTDASRSGPAAPLPHARTRAGAWSAARERAGELVLLLDFDGTLAPIVERPEMAGMPDRTRRALDRLREDPSVRIAVVSGRGMHDARERVGIPDIAYAGNHGMEIEGPGVERIHPEAAAARPRLQRVLDRVAEATAGIRGALVEDKGLTLSIHYRQVDRAEVDDVRRAARAAVEATDGLRLTEGKEVLEVRPDVEWDKGRAVDFLLRHMAPREGAPVLYIGDDTTDEDAFRALRSWPGGAGEGVVVGERPAAATAARCYVRDPGEVAELLEALGGSAGR